MEHRNILDNLYDSGTNTPARSLGNEDVLAPISWRHPILIIGAGITGLTLAHALTKANIPCIVFDSGDYHVKSDNRVFTIHRALDSFENCIPHYVLSGLSTCQVSESGSSASSILPFYDLSTGLGDPRHLTYLGRILRFEKNSMRARLIQSASNYIRWRMVLMKVECIMSTDTEELDHIVAHFHKRTRDKETVTIKGSLIVGANGAWSTVRRHIIYTRTRGPVPTDYVRLIITARIPRQLMAPLLVVHPSQFRGSHPDNGCYMSISILPTSMVNYFPGPNFQVRIELSFLRTSWIAIYPHGSDGSGPAIDFTTLLFHAANGCFPELKKVIEYAAAHPETRGETFPLLALRPQRHARCHSRVTLVGNAAHVMSPYTDDDINHNIEDVVCLVQKLVEYAEDGLDAALSSYEVEMRNRTEPAVKARHASHLIACDLCRTHADIVLQSCSWKACEDAHNYCTLNSQSPLFTVASMPVFQGANESDPSMSAIGSPASTFDLLENPTQYDDEFSSAIRSC